MSDVTLLWFQCKNNKCEFIPIKTKREKIKKYWMHGKSLADSYRQRMFMRYAEGNYRSENNGDRLFFESKLYGTIKLYDKDSEMVNSFYYPIKDKEMCDKCIEKTENEKRLLQ